MNYIAQKLTLPGEWEGGSDISGPTGFQFNSLGELISQPVTKYVFAFAGIGLLLMLVRAGFSFLTSAGDAKKLEEGKQRMTYAIIGFLVIFAAYWIVQILGKIFGIEAIQTNFL